MAFPQLSPLDRRLNAWREDLADIRLKGRVDAASFVDGQPGHVIRSLADLRREPRPECGLDHQLLRGDDVLIFETRGEWCWVQAQLDGYVGWTRSEVLADGPASVTHVVTVPRTFLYPGADLRFPATGALSMGSRVNVTGQAQTRGTDYCLLDDGNAVIAGHLQPVGAVSGDAVAIALRFLEAPYLWGGASGFGLDCSGLVHLAMRMVGQPVLRDSDMQAASIGTPLDADAQLDALQRGDLVFWRGHVGFVGEAGLLLHASGHSMQVTLEPLAEAIDRIARLYERPIGFRRPLASAAQ